MNKRISIIVPVYNAEKYLKQCVNSLLNQTYRDIEVILVDDGSTDTSPAVCDAFSEMDSRVKVIHQKNARIGAARNRGIEEATGEYLTFIDSDDYIESNAYEVCMKLIEKYNADLIQWDLTFVPEQGCQGIIENRAESEYTELVLDREAALQKLYEWKNMDPRFNHLWTDTHCIWTKLCKREVFEGIRFPIGKEYEDEMILHKVLYNCHKAVFVNCRFSNYRLRATSTVHTMPLKGQVDKVDAGMDRYQLMKQIGKDSLIRGVVHSCLVGIFNCYLQTNHEANEEFKRKMKCYAKRIQSESWQYIESTDKIVLLLLLNCPSAFLICYGFYRKVK